MTDLARSALLVLALIAAGLFAVGCGGDHADDHGGQTHEDEEDGHEGHDHDDPAHEDEGEEDGHEGHDHDDPAHEDEGEEDVHEDHDDGDTAHEDEGEEDGHEGHDHAAEAGEHVEVTAEQRRRIGLKLAVAGPGRIARNLNFPGEIELNPDRLAHVVPRAAGIVREVQGTLGDAVEAGEVLAWIDSAELAEAKLAFYSKEAEVSRCNVELPRSRTILENVHRLVAALRKNPSMEELAKLDGLEMGERRGSLIAAYAEFIAATKAYERERDLRDKSISSGSELVTAQAEFQRARAGFNASLDTAHYEVLVAFGEAARTRQVAEFEAIAAEQKLRLKGVDEKTIESLRGLVPMSAGLKPCECDDPECKENEIASLREVLGKDQRLGWYPLRAPLRGVIIEKHLTLGEKVGEDEAVLAIADASSVWINFGVFQKDLADIRTGQTVTVTPTGVGSSHPGRISYVSPLLDPETRTARARVVLPNEGNVLRPGLFVNVRVALAHVEAAVIVPRSAVQILDEKEIVFIEKGDGFEAVPVTLGRGDREMVEVRRGLKAGQRFVKRGAFELKAKIATSGMDAHAGHGH